MSIQVDWALIQQLVTDYAPKNFNDSAEGYRIFEQTLGTDIDLGVYDIIDQNIEYSTKVEITLDEQEKHELIVLAPASLLSPIPRTKKKKPKARSRAQLPREFLMRIPIEDNVLDDYNLFKDCLKLGTNLTEHIGPYLNISPGRISLTFGLHLSQRCNGGIPDSAIRQSQTAAQVFARVLNKPEIMDPPAHEKNLEDMFEALTSPKPFANDTIVVPGVLTPLQKFQCQSVRWCLAREGCRLDKDNKLVPTELPDAFEGWHKLEKWWVNPYSVQIQTEPPEPTKHQFGGLLAEEMGLGKTLEVISLIKLHPRPPTREGEQQLITNENTGQQIRKVSATLVIVPGGIMDQWVTELESHAPGIKIINYSGKGTVTPDDLDVCDVVLASYSIIASEFYSAQFNPGQRNTRFWQDRDDIRSVRSSLVQVQFWRVVLDEVQMLHAGVNNAARVAGLVPRVNAWAVTGTPVKNSMSDLRGQFSFLGIEPFAGKRAFERLLTLPQDFIKVVSQAGIRHTKFLLRDELRLPPQRRRLIMPSFNEMERLFYESVREDWTDPADSGSERTLRTLLVKLRQACCINSTREQSVFSDSNGATLTVEQALLQLTQEGESRYTRLLRHRAGLLIEKGQLKLMEGGPEEAMKLLVQQLEPLEEEIAKSKKLKDETTDKKQSLEERIKLEKGIVKEMTYELEVLGMKIAGGNTPGNSQNEGSEKDQNKQEGSDQPANLGVDENDSTDEESIKLEKTEEQQPEIKQELNLGLGAGPKSDSNTSKEKLTSGPAQDTPATASTESDNTSPKTEEPASVANPKELIDVSSNPEFARKRFEIIDKETALDDLHVTNHYYSSVIKSAITHINACKELQHRAFFFLGTCFFRLGQPKEDGKSDAQAEEEEEVPKELTPEEKKIKEEFYQKELEFYTKADDTRSELLNEEHTEFLRVRDKLKEPSIFEYESPANVYHHFFNSQAGKMKEVYGELMTILRGGLLELNAEDEDVYTTSMEIQDKGYVYLNALQTMIRDREQILNGTAQNVKKVAGKRKRNELDIHNEERTESVELFEKELSKTIAEIRKPVDVHELAERKRVEKANEAKFKSLEKEYRRKKDKLSESEQRERDFNLEKISSVTHENSSTLKADIRAWKREVGVLTEVFNTRLKYFKSLQNISDHVREPEFADVNAALVRKENSIRQAQVDLESASSRLRFIAQLEVQMPLERESRDKEQDNECVICQDTYIHGSFTTCGHRCCTPCLSNWLSKNPICPICKTNLGPSDVFQFRVGDPGMAAAPGASVDVKCTKDDLGNDVYEHVSSGHYNEILRQPLKKTYGVKIDMIVRHVLLLKQQDPEVQVVVFTQWNRMLQALTHALIQHGIRALRKTQPKSVTHFRTNKDVTCFMLHTSNDSAGLTLTNATHVILCEPLLTTAIELQAISRIHRIGQFHPTTVWLFAIQDTVEQQILALAIERRVGMAKQKRQSDEAVESDILTSTVGPLVDKASGSEVIVAKDIRRILELE